MANQKRLSDATPRRRDGQGGNAPREGRALLQGLLRCGRCGYPMCVRFGGDHGRYPVYFCNRNRAELGLPQPVCLNAANRYLDIPVVDCVLNSLTQQNLQGATEVVALIDQQDAALDQQWTLRLERARYEARRAERQYDACDPDNRVVARTLETRWNDKLVELEKLEKEYEDTKRRARTVLSDIDRRRILELADDLPRLWRAKTTTDRDRKLLLRLLLKEVSVRSIDVPRDALRIRLLWHTGVLSELECDRTTKPREPVRWSLVATSTSSVSQ